MADVTGEAKEPLRVAFDRVHEQSLREMATFTADQLEWAADMPYAVYPTNLGSLLFCSHHEMIHAGQIGLLRRLLGRAPIR